MQQLTLFKNNTAGSLQNPSARRRKNVKAKTGGTQWDLWTQETEVEKEMAMLFLDIRNFTPLVEKQQAIDVIQIVKKLFSRFQNIIRIHHGQIIETSGDGFYAAFGFDRSTKEAVNDSVQAGMSILSSLENLNDQLFERKLNQRIDVGIGVHVGKVATGNLHLGSKDHFIVMGYPVNVASRLQAATKELKNNFIVSSAIFKALKNPPLHSLPVKAKLKGMATPVELHLLGKDQDQD